MNTSNKISWKICSVLNGVSTAINLRKKKKREKGAEEGTILDSLAQSRNMVKEKLAPQEVYQLRRLLI